MFLVCINFLLPSPYCYLHQNSTTVHVTITKIVGNKAPLLHIHVYAHTGGILNKTLIRCGCAEFAKPHTPTTTDIRALAVLSTAESWEWPPLKRRIQQSGAEQGDKFQALITPNLLSGFIEASQTYPHSQLVDHFWLNFQRGHAGLQKNGELLLVWS